MLPKLELSLAFESLEFIIWGHKINKICKLICQAICWNMMNWICCSEFGTSLFILWSLPRVNDLTETTATFTWPRRSNAKPLFTDVCHPKFSQSYYYVCIITGVSLEAGLLATRGNYWVQPNILQLFTITPHLKDGCSSFFHGGCDIGLDFDLALKSQVYIVWKFHIVGRLRRIMLSFSRLRELS